METKRGVNKGNISHQEGNQESVKSEKPGPQRNPNQDRRPPGLNAKVRPREFRTEKVELDLVVKMGVKKS